MILQKSFCAAKCLCGNMIHFYCQDPWVNKKFKQIFCDILNWPNVTVNTFMCVCWIKNLIPNFDLSKMLWQTTQSQMSVFLHLYLLTTRPLTSTGAPSKNTHTLCHRVHKEWQHIDTTLDFVTLCRSAWFYLYIFLDIEMTWTCTHVLILAHVKILIKKDTLSILLYLIDLFQYLIHIQHKNV